MASRPTQRPPRRTGWHPGFAQLASERCPVDFEVHPEFPLSQEPRRADLLLVRRTTDRVHGTAGDEKVDSSARALRGLWPRIPRVGLVEFKSPSHEFRRGDLVKLYSYGSEYLHLHWEEFPVVSDLVLVLVNPSLSTALLSDIERIGGNLEPLGNGYARMSGGVHYMRMYIVATNEVATAENDAYLRIFSHEHIDNPEAAHWFRQWLAQEVTRMGDPARVKDFDDMLEKLLQTRLAKLSDEERLAGLSPERRLAGLSSEERLAGLSDEELRAFMELIGRRLKP